MQPHAAAQLRGPTNPVELMIASGRMHEGGFRRETMFDPKSGVSVGHDTRIYSGDIVVYSPPLWPALAHRWTLGKMHLENPTGSGTEETSESA